MNLYFIYQKTGLHLRAYVYFIHDKEREKTKKTNVCVLCVRKRERVRECKSEEQKEKKNMMKPFFWFVCFENDRK